MVSRSNSWVVRFRVVSAPKVRLFCFPYAGGSSTIFARWHSVLPSDVELCAIELPGHGTRMRERAFATDFVRLVEDLSVALERWTDVPFLFFGHSLGAVLAFACARSLRRRSAAIPVHLFASARRAPHAPNRDSSEARMTDSQLVESIRQRGGTPPEILAEPELMNLLLPVIRADFCLLASYVYSEETPLDCPITTFGGTRDERATRHDLLDWRVHSSSSFGVEMFEGGHFFVNESWRKVATRVGVAIAS